MADAKDTEHALTPKDPSPPTPEPTRDRGVPATGPGESDAKGAPTDDRQDSETAGDQARP